MFAERMYIGVSRARPTADDLRKEVDIKISLTCHLLPDLDQNFLKLGPWIHQAPTSWTRNSGVTMEGEKKPAAVLNILNLACFRTFAR